MPILGIMASAMSANLWQPEGAYDSLATVTVPSGGVASVTFAGIPSTYKHLQLRVVNLRSSADIMQIELNNDTTTTNYYWHRLDGDGTSVSGVAGNKNLIGYVGNTTAPAANIIDFLDYTNISKTKTLRNLFGEDRNGSGVVALQSMLWNNTSSLNSILLKCESGGNFNEYSTFALYGTK